MNEKLRESRFKTSKGIWRYAPHIFKTEVLLASDVTRKETAGSVCYAPEHVIHNDVDL